MKKFINTYANPLLIIIISGLLYSFVYSFIPTEQKEVILGFLRACACFFFGISIYQNRKSRTWVKKLIVAFIFVLLLLYDMGHVVFYQFTYVLNILKIRGFIINLIYVFLGWIFFD